MSDQYLDCKCLRCQLAQAEDREKKLLIRIESLRNQPVLLRTANNVIKALRRKLKEVTGTTQYHQSEPSFDEWKARAEMAEAEIEALRKGSLTCPA